MFSINRNRMPDFVRLGARLQTEKFNPVRNIQQSVRERREYRIKGKIPVFGMPE